MLGGLADTLKNMVETEIGIKVRCNILGTAQRAAAHCASATDAAEAFMTGVEAVRLVARGRSGLMVTLERSGDENYFCYPGSITEAGWVAPVCQTGRIASKTPAGRRGRLIQHLPVDAGIFLSIFKK